MTKTEKPAAGLSKAFQEFLKGVLMEKLTDRERRIVALRQKDVFGFETEQMALRRIGTQEGLSVESIRQIVFKSARKIERRILIINERLKEPQVIVKYIEKPEAQAVANLPIVYKPVGALGEMEARVVNALKIDGIETVQQLIERSERNLLRLPNFGRKSLAEVKDLLAAHDLDLARQGGSR